MTKSSGQPRRHLLQSGWSVFVSSKRLVAGDAFIFLRFVYFEWVIDCAGLLLYFLFEKRLIKNVQGREWGAACWCQAGNETAG